MDLLIAALIIGLLPAAIAKGKGRSFGLWWFYGFALFIVALPHAILLRPDRAALDEEQLREGKKKCPDCAEFVQKEARVCRYCGRSLDDSSAGRPA